MNHLLSPNRAALLCAVCLTTTVALADPSVENPRSVKLEIVPAELQSPAVQKLYERIQLAAQDACTKLDSRELALHRLYLRCVDDAVARAVADIHSRELTEVHLSAHGEMLPPRL
jgi:UrcA family protein